MDLWEERRRKERRWRCGKACGEGRWSKMANRTDLDADDVYGSDPQHVLPNILRQKIYENHYWLSACFGLNAETLVDRAVKIDHVGMTYGPSMKATEFVCLVLKVCLMLLCISFSLSIARETNS